MIEGLVRRLRELALTLPRPGCEWEERPRFDPPAPPEAVAAFEQAVGFPLPGGLVAFLAQTGSVVAMSIHNGYWLGGLPHLDRSAFPREIEGHPAAPIGTDGGGNAFLITSDNVIWRWSHETGRASRVARSFEEFLERVAADWEAYIDDTPDWRYLTS